MSSPTSGHCVHCHSTCCLSSPCVVTHDVASGGHLLTVDVELRDYFEYPGVHCRRCDDSSDFDVDEPEQPMPGRYCHKGFHEFDARKMLWHNHCHRCLAIVVRTAAQLRDENSDTRCRAISAFNTLRHTARAPFIPLLVELALDDDSDFQPMAINLLSRCDGALAVSSEAERAPVMHCMATLLGRWRSLEWLALRCLEASEPDEIQAEARRANASRINKKPIGRLWVGSAVGRLWVGCGLWAGRQTAKNRNFSYKVTV